MNNEVPGVHVPEPILERMRAADTKEAARAEGITIAREMLAALMPHIQGVQISAPFARYQTAIDVAEVIPDSMRSGAGADSE
jgi:homocysteine S-methyltransferase